MSRPFTKLAPLILAATFASCGSAVQTNGQANGDGAVDNASLTSIALTSDDFRSGELIPSDFTCDGSDRRPVLRWTDAPQGTKSFALVVDDPDAPNGTFRHWGVFDIPSAVRSIGGRQHLGTEVTNDFGKQGYKGPCPPRGHGVHHYHFKLFALDVGNLGLSSNSKVVELENSARSHAIAEGELIGTYERR